MAIRIGSNISSLQAQRQLSETASTLSKVSERLASGQRINRASDDAAGLSIASALGAGRKVFTQGVRNLNDGISGLSIADSTVAGLTDIVIRIRELAEQAANGTFSAKQRQAIDTEAQALQKEYFRVSRQASFNGLNLFDGSLSSGLRLQGGYGTSGLLQGSLGGVMGDGTFGARTSYYTVAGMSASVTLGDLNGDGVLDMVTADRYDPVVSVFLGRGDGRFSSTKSYATAGGGVVIDGPSSVVLGDLNRDGVLDMVATDVGGDTASIFLGRGDGTFSARITCLTGENPRSAALADLNGDGILDMVTARMGDNVASVFLGRGDGTFSAGTSYSTGMGPRSVALGDINGDGVLDMVTADVSDDKVSVFLGRGDGTFAARVSYATGLAPTSLVLGDLNGDGALDMVATDYNDGKVSVFIGRGNGTFSARVSYAAGSAPNAVVLGDVNGDGSLDLVTSNYDDSTSVLIGRGDGTFAASVSIAAGDVPVAVALGDLNGDGVLDMVTADYYDVGVSVLLGNTREGVAPLLPFSLTTQAGARQALGPLDRKLAQLSSQRGVLGAFQSRISSAINTLQSTTENYAAAEARIRDADVAFESSVLTRLKIVQQSAASILAQANLQPSLALTLLGRN